MITLSDSERIEKLVAEIARLRATLAAVHTALIVAGWRDDQLVRHVKAEAARTDLP